ncbi:MAG: Asp-tRNA(Asn)/Glu-tRNA(Gln) amidotransferase subunit GatB, partial [Oscillospiraceae bacterium]
PILNKQVVEYAVLMGHALHCNINRITKNDRKNYFYPDLPKAYQISQFDIPLCGNGYLDIMVGKDIKRVGITRIHIEEDAGKLIHDEAHEGKSLADYNRCGVPLIEIVSEPDMRSAEEAKAYIETIHTTLLYLGISDAKMQEGSVRADVNVSIHKKGEPFGTRTEMKNVTGFGNIFRSIEYESKRQMEIVENGGEIHQETRRWDDMQGISILLRTKEDAQDYRYFPDPDLLTFEISEERVQELKKSLPELPADKAMRYVKQLGLNEVDANLLSVDKSRADFFDKCVALGKNDAKLISNWIMGDIAAYLNENRIDITETALTVDALCEMISLIENKTISNTAAKTVLEIIIKEKANISDIVKEKGLAQISDTGALSAIVDTVISENAKAVEDFKNGKTNAIGFMVGQCMKASKGKGNPALLQKMITEKINTL